MGCLGRLGDVGSLWTLLPMDNLELDAIAFRERLEAAALDGAEVDKDIRSSLARDEAVALGVVEPLHRTLETCHERYLLELCSRSCLRDLRVRSTPQRRVRCHRDRLDGGAEVARGKFCARCRRRRRLSPERRRRRRNVNCECQLPDSGERSGAARKGSALW